MCCRVSLDQPRIPGATRYGKEVVSGQRTRRQRCCAAPPAAMMRTCWQNPAGCLWGDDAGAALLDRMRNRTQWLLAGFVALAALFAMLERGIEHGPAIESMSNAEQGDRIVATAFENRQSNLQIRGRGRVSRLLADDNDGSRHQRFILTLASGHTLLIVHNIDLAPRVAPLDVGDEVEFHGEYEWSEQGGLVHWTHHDPQGGHPAGWLKHEGRVYQ